MGRIERPIRGSVEVASGRLTRHALSRDYTRVYRDVYIRKGVPMTALVRALAAAESAGPNAVLVGQSAAALYFTKWLDPEGPAEVNRAGRFRAPPGMVARRYALAADEDTVRLGVRLTTPARTAFDIGRSDQPRRDVVAILDALCRATELDPHEIAAIADRHPTAPGVARLRKILPMVDGGADSPPETHTRLLLIDAGLPRPETQLTVRDASGSFIAACDLGWRKWQVIVEYDGKDHWSKSQRAYDIERHALIEEQGWVIIRVGADLLYRHPAVLVERVRAKLRAAGADI